MSPTLALITICLLVFVSAWSLVTDVLVPSRQR